MNLIQCSFCVLIAEQVIGVRQLLVPMLLLVIREVLGDIPAFMKLATLNENAIAVVLLDRSSHSTASINHSHKVLLELQPAAAQFIEQLIANLLVLCGPLMKTQD